MKKRNISTLLCMISCVGLLAGCGGQYAGRAEGDTVSGPAVSGDAIQEKTVSGPAVKNGKDKVSDKNTEQDMSSHRFCTDTNLYYVDYDEEKIMQARPDGTHHKCIKKWPAKKDEELWLEIVYVDENWLYYNVMIDDMDGSEITYRVPVEKDAQGYDVVKFSKEEELVKADLIFPVYADSDYYFYKKQSFVGNKQIIEDVKYDLKQKRTVMESEAEMVHIFRIKDYYVNVSSEIYIQDMDSDQWEKVSDYVDDPEAPVDATFTYNDKAFFYIQYAIKEVDDRSCQIKRHDGKQETDFVTWEQLNYAVKEAAGEEKLDVCMPDELFWQEERLYIQMQTGWMEDGTYHMGYMIFSQGENEDGSGSGLRYEKELTECMKSYVKEWSGKWRDSTEVDVKNMVVNNAKCIAMLEGKAYLSLFDHEKDKGRLGCYDLDTGKLKWIDKQDAAFYKLAYDCGNPYYFGGVFDEYGDNEFVDDWKWNPSKDEYEDGTFVEDKKQ